MPNPEDMLRIVRLKYPNSIAGEVYKDWPMEYNPKAVRKYKRMVIRGGPVHDHVKGFHMEPFRLVIETGHIDEFEDSIFNLDFIKSSEIVDEYDKYKLSWWWKKYQWKRRIRKFNKENNLI